jgi:hypothetical protein
MRLRLLIASAAGLLAAAAFGSAANAQLYVVQYGSAQIGGGLAPFSYGAFYGVQALPAYSTPYEPQISRLVYGYTPNYVYGSPYGYWPNYTYPRAFVISHGPAALVASRYAVRTRFVEPLTVHEVLYGRHRHYHRR